MGKSDVATISSVVARQTGSSAVDTLVRKHKDHLAFMFTPKRSLYFRAKWCMRSRRRGFVGVGSAFNDRTELLFVAMSSKLCQSEPKYKSRLHWLMLGKVSYVYTQTGTAQKTF